MTTADELLDRDLEPEDDENVDLPAAGLLRPPPPRAPRRSVPNPALRTALLDLVGMALEAKVAHDVDDDDRTRRALADTAHRAAQLEEVVRTSLAALVTPRA